MGIPGHFMFSSHPCFIPVPKICEFYPQYTFPCRRDVFRSRRPPLGNDCQPFLIVVKELRRPDSTDIPQLLLYDQHIADGDARQLILLPFCHSPEPAQARLASVAKAQTSASSRRRSGQASTTSPRPAHPRQPYDSARPTKKRSS